MDRISFRPGILAGPLKKVAASLGLSTSDAAKVLLAEMLGVHDYEPYKGNMGLPAAHASASRWAKHRTEKRSGK